MDKDYKYELGACKAIAEDKSNSSARLPILVEREKEYGNFGTNARLAQAIKLAIFKELDALDIPETAIQAEALDMIGSKLARIAHNPNHKDSWKDIIGYCTLVLEELEF